MSNAAPNDDLDQRIDDLSGRIDRLSEEGLYRSEAAVCRELRRLTKAEQRLMPYLGASFNLMNHAGGRLEPAEQAQVAVELIALLENEDHARLIQPDLPEAEYEHAVHWMTACGYDNLAVATGRMKGFNSDGMHACINDGIQVCRRTGKLQCITCFREYATAVYRAADDLDMALHFARLGESHQVVGPHDRRWIGARDQALLELLRGDLDAALDATLRAWKLADTYHNPRSSRWETHATLTTVLLMMGREGDFDRLLSETGVPTPPVTELELPAAGENGELEYMKAGNDALRASIEGRHDDAIAILDRYDRLLSQRNYLHEWFETRLRIVAALRLADREDAMKAQARPLETRANAARDWLTLRRLTRLLDMSVPATPLALLGDVTSGPYAVAPRPEPAPAIADEPAEGQGESSEERPELTATQQRLTGLFVRMQEADPEQFGDVAAAVLNDALAIEPAEVTLPNEARPLLHLVRMLAGEGSDGPVIWRWARRVAAPFPRDAEVLSQLGSLGHKLMVEGCLPPEGDASPEAIASIFRQSLDLDPNDSRGFARAGAFYLDQDDASEAERCLARGFRLDRTDSFLATNLAKLYQNSDRPRDAVAVLDLCLREGSDDPDVSWEAAVLASSLEQWESLLSYLDHYEAHLPEQPWACYYRALALLELGRPAEALNAAEEEARRNPDAPFASAVLAACALGALGRDEEFREALGRIARARLSEVTYLTHRGLVRLHQILWKFASEALPSADPLRTELEDQQLATGLASDELFEAVRKGGEPVEDVNFYEVVLSQPLDESWSSSRACLANEDAWASYLIPWGVLARDEDEAAAIARDWQRRCYPLPAEVASIEVRGEGYRDCVGVVFQGLRQGEEG